MDAYVKLASDSLKYYLENKKYIKVPEGLPHEMLDRRAGVFVSLKKNGQLRGCIGTIESVRDSIAEEIIRNAVSAGIGDPRFFQVSEYEFSTLDISVDVLGESFPVTDRSILDAKRYGVIVSLGGRKGLLLPNLEGVETPEEQIDIALDKAGISEIEDYELAAFEVIRHY